MELPALRELFDQATAEADRLLAQAEAMDALLSRGEDGRTARSESRPIEIIRVAEADGRIEASIQGVGAAYTVSITVSPRRAYRCSCPDSRRRGRAVGPCKHTLALARHWGAKLESDLDRIEGGLINLLF